MPTCLLFSPRSSFSLANVVSLNSLIIKSDLKTRQIWFHLLHDWTVMGLWMAPWISQIQWCFGKPSELFPTFRSSGTMYHNDTLLERIYQPWWRRDTSLENTLGLWPPSPAQLTTEDSYSSFLSTYESRDGTQRPWGKMWLAQGSIVVSSKYQHFHKVCLG